MSGSLVHILVCLNLHTAYLFQEGISDPAWEHRRGNPVLHAFAPDSPGLCDATPTTPTGKQSGPALAIHVYRSERSWQELLLSRKTNTFRFENSRLKEETTMESMTKNTERPDLSRLLFEPNVWINGLIEQKTLSTFLESLANVRRSGEPLMLELNTEGGDADIARRIASEIRYFLSEGRTGYVIGKSYVYSAGVTILAAFPRETRFLTDDAVLLIHERHLTKTIDMNGPIEACLQIVREQLSLLETSKKLEMEGFREFVCGSDISVEDLLESARKNCYMHAAVVAKHRLIGKVIGRDDLAVTGLQAA
jgi:ATP-dependent protease ClpP protease subunit